MKMEVPMAFQSAMAGIMLAGEMIKLSSICYANCQAM